MLQAPLLTKDEEVALARSLRAGRVALAQALSSVPAAAATLLAALSQANAGSRPITDVFISPLDDLPSSADFATRNEPGELHSTRATTTGDLGAALRETYEAWLETRKHGDNAAVMAAARRLAGAFQDLQPAPVILKEALDICVDLDARRQAIELRTGVPLTDILHHTPPLKANGEQCLATPPIAPSQGAVKADDRGAARAELLAVQREAGVDLTTLRECCRVGVDAYAQYQQARRQLIEANLRLAYSLAKKLRDRGLEFDDLFQQATLGLMRAVDKFDERLGCKFSTYAVLWIRQALYRYFADASRTIRLPSHVHATTVRLKKQAQRLEQKLGREPSAAELAAESQLTLGAVQTALRGMLPPASLDAPLAGFEGLPLVDAIATDQEDDFAAVADAIWIADFVQTLLDRLPPREALVLRLRNGIGVPKEYTLDHIGDIIGVSRERTRQLEAAALKRLRHVLDARLHEGLRD
jgi:RNA polymerase sigma factor (sigma-70 family)